jgi:hypothetical protein
MITSGSDAGGGRIVRKSALRAGPQASLAEPQKKPRLCKMGPPSRPLAVVGLQMERTRTTGGQGPTRPLSFQDIVWIGTPGPNCLGS